MDNKKRCLVCFAFLAVLFVSSLSVNAAAPSGIAGNGVGGIYIDINAAPYTAYANIPTWGQYAYGPAGCAWFASARVNQLTGANCTIYSGKSWYNSAYSSFGFSRGTGLRAKALACYENHVAVVESVNGNNVVVSEGGYESSNSNASTGYCIIHTMSKAQLESARNGAFLGYVYLSAGGSSPSGHVEYSSISVGWVDTWNALLQGKINNPSRLTVSSVGVQIWDSTGNMVVNHSEACGLSTSTVNQELNIVGEAFPTGLKQGETYTFRMWANANGTTYQSEKGSFTIRDDQQPVITDVYVSDVSDTGYTVHCTVTDNFRVDRVQFPTWTLYNDQDDLIPDWGSNRQCSGTSNGNSYTYRVNISDHNYELGEYITHIYAYDPAGNVSSFAVPTQNIEKIEDDIPPVILSKEITYPDAETAHVKIIASDNIELGKLESCLPAYSDYRKENMPVNDVYEFEWKLRGDYTVCKVELYDKAGNKTSFQLLLGEPKDELVLKANGLACDIETIKEIYLGAEYEPLSVCYYEDDFLKIEDEKIIPRKAGLSKCALSKYSAYSPVSMALYVRSVDNTTVNINKKQLTLTTGNFSEILLAEVTPINVKDKTVTWSSEDPSIAKVSPSGEVTAVRNGKTVIKAVSKEDGQSDACEVTVNFPDGSVSTQPEKPVQPTERECMIIFQANGGSNLSQGSVKVKENQILWELPTVQRKNYAFEGWYTAKTGGSKWSSGMAVTQSQTLYAHWKKITKPGRVSIRLLKKQGKGKFKIKYQEVAGVKGYEISYSMKRKFKSGTKKTLVSSLSKSVKGLKKGKIYYVRVRAYKIDSMGRKVYGNYSKVRKIKV